MRRAAGKEHHSTLDMVWGVTQVPLSDQAQNILTICTRRGLFRWKG